MFKTLLRGAILSLVFAVVGPAAAQPAPPPESPPSTQTLPTTKEQCFNGGWKNNFTVFKNQGDCVSYVATKTKNPPALTPPSPPPTPPK